jgi:hypothetical protein
MRRRERKRNERDGPVTVLESSDPVLLAVAKSVLEGANIEYFAKGEAVQNLLVGASPSPLESRSRLALDFTALDPLALVVFLLAVHQA